MLRAVESSAPIRPPSISLALLIVLALSSATPATARPVAGVEQLPRFLQLQRHDSVSQRARWSSAAPRIVQAVAPDEADPRVQRYLRDSVVVLGTGSLRADAPLFVYLVGTGGAPDDAKRLLSAAADQGYRALGLMYNDLPATAQACAHDADPGCAEHFRARRSFGSASSSDIDDQPQESVQQRLLALLRWLDHAHPDQGWASYLNADGGLRWSRLVLAGHSQGAGLAAFIAQRHSVQRVVLFSSPWDYFYAEPSAGTGPAAQQRRLAPWLHGASATPAARWYGAYHAREPQARSIALAFQALAVPAAQVRVLALPPVAGHSEHGSVCSDGGTPLLADGSPAYLADWKFLIGQAGPIGGPNHEPNMQPNSEPNNEPRNERKGEPR